MRLWSVIDGLLVALLVLGSSIYAIYSLGSVRIKRRMLEQLIRCCGMRAYNWLSPRVGGCNGCGGVTPKIIGKRR